MEHALCKQIERECKKLIRRYCRDLAEIHKNQSRYRKRTGLEPGIRAQLFPNHWTLDDQFNPFKVLAKKELYAHVISRKIRDQTYQPLPTLQIQIPKLSGGTRTITILRIVDAAVSSTLFVNLRQRNQHLYSSYAYAYRRDRFPQQAVSHLLRYTKSASRLYALEYDFAKYFDSVRHEYLREILGTFYTASRQEDYLIREFLTIRHCAGNAAFSAGISEPALKGFPQGASISLFLANIACFELDTKIEQEGAVYARYADDSIVLSKDYSVASRCVNHFIEHGIKAGTQINFGKSEGLSLITPEPRGEMRSKHGYNFLSYRIEFNTVSASEEPDDRTKVTISKGAVAKIKQKLNDICYRHLLKYPMEGHVSLTRFTEGGTDWDVVTCINELRRYIYGGITEARLNQCIASNNLRLHMTKSVLSYYPLVSDSQLWKDLDGWLLDRLHAVGIKRAATIRLLHPDISVSRPTFRAYSKAELISGEWYTEEISNETKLPSFYKSWVYVQKLTKVYDLSHFRVPDYNYAF